MRRHTIVLAAGVLLASATPIVSTWRQPAGANGSDRYIVTDVGSLGGSFTDALGVNDRGQVAGLGLSPSDTALRGFFWDGGPIHDVGDLGGPQTGVGPINNRGQIAGSSNTTTPAPPSLFNQDSVFCNPPMVAGEATVECHAMLVDHGRLRDLGTLGGHNSAAENRGLNELGHVAGVAETGAVDPTSPSGWAAFHAFLWRGGKMMDLGTLGAGPDSVAFAVNDLDQVVGADFTGNSSFHSSVGWLWQAGRKTALGTLGGSFSMPSAVNDWGQVVGASHIAGDATRHAFLWQRGHMTDLGTLPGDVLSEAADINELGQVVGISCSTTQCRPVLWQGGKILDLNSMIPASSGWQVLDVQVVNNRGQLAGSAFGNGEVHAVVLTPAH